MCARLGMRTRGRRGNPAGWTQRGWARRGKGGGHSSTWLIMPTGRVAKQVWHLKIMAAGSVCPKFNAKANPIPASKLAFVKNLEEIYSIPYWNSIETLVLKVSANSTALDLVRKCVQHHPCTSHEPFPEVLPLVCLCRIDSVWTSLESWL